MSKVSTINKLLGFAYSNFEAEAKHMAARVAEFYPVGTKLHVIHAARQDGPDTITTVEVIAAPTWYRRPEMLKCRYYYGSKVRDFPFTDIVDIVGLPDKGEDEL